MFVHHCPSQFCFVAAFLSDGCIDRHDIRSRAFWAILQLAEPKVTLAHVRYNIPLYSAAGLSVCWPLACLRAHSCTHAHISNWPDQGMGALSLTSAITRITVGPRIRLTCVPFRYFSHKSFTTKVNLDFQFRRYLFHFTLVMNFELP